MDIRYIHQHINIYTPYYYEGKIDQQNVPWASEGASEDGPGGGGGSELAEEDSRATGDGCCC